MQSKLKFLSVLLAICLAASPVHADLLRETGLDLASPVTTPAKTVLIVGTSLAITAAIFEDQISDPLQKELTEDQPIGKFATKMGTIAGPLAPNFVYAFGMGLYGWLGESESAQTHALVMAKASIYAIGVTTAMKYLVHEPRPDGSDPYSFPSGHTTAAFSFASVIQAEHGWLLGGVAYAWATTVGLGRMNDNRHFLHDVLMGATIGTSYGLGLHFRELAKTAASETVFQILPIDDLNGAFAVYSSTF